MTDAMLEILHGRQIIIIFVCVVDTTEYNCCDYDKFCVFWFEMIDGGDVR